MAASIFDPPVGTRTFTAADWLAVIDVQPVGATPTFDEPEIAIDDEPLAPWDSEPAAELQYRVRNTPWAIIATCAAMIYIMLVVTAFYAPPELAVAGMAACALLFAFWLILAWRFDRL